MRFMGTRLAVIGVAALAAVGVPATSGATDDLCAPRTVSIGDATASEDSGVLKFKVFSSGCAGGSVQFKALSGAGGLAPAVAAVDFFPASGQIGWIAGEVATRTIAVPVNDDLAAEPDEGLTVVLHTPAGVSIMDSVGKGVIVDDEAPAVFLSEPFCGMETCLTCWVRVGLDRPVPFDVRVRFVTHDGTAVSTTDYVAADTWVTIPARATQVQVAVPILDDRAPEPTEDLFASIAQASAGHVTAGRVTLVINDDDAQASAAPGARLP